MKNALAFAAALALLVLPHGAARAQSAYVVASCSGNTLALGPNQPLVEDVNGKLCVNTGGAGGAQDVNLTGINGTAPVTGHGTATDALRVELPTDGTGKVGLNAGTAIVGKVGIDQTTPGTTNGVQLTGDSQTTTNFVSGTTAAMTGTTSTSLLAAPGASLRNYITQITCVNSHASVGTFITVQDGSGGTALYTLAAGSVFGGSAVQFPTPLRQPTTNTALYVTNVTTGANVICSASGYKGS